MTFLKIAQSKQILKTHGQNAFLRYLYFICLCMWECFYISYFVTSFTGPGW